MGKGSKNLAAGSNPLEIIQDSRVLSAGGGALAAQLARKALIGSARKTFGTAINTSQGVRYADVDAAGKPKITVLNGVVTDAVEVPGARLARALLNIGMVVVGTLLIGGSEEPNIEYLGLGFAASGAANTFATLFGIDV